MPSLFQRFTTPSILCLLGAVSLSFAALALQQPVGKPAAKPAPSSLTPQAREFFEKRIRPVLVQHCYSCHAGTNRQGGLRLDTREELRKGGASGKAILPGQPAQSLLIQAMRHQHARFKMPPAGRLPEKVIADFEQWVAQGAPDPRTETPTAKPAAPAWAKVLNERKKWWSLQPLRVGNPPVVKGKAGATHPVDRYLLAKLEAQGLTPAAPADRRTLARRTALILTGLLPTPQELDTFLQEKTPNAYARYVDRLLASPHFGEQWARHWMDIVRYGETHGYEWNYEIRDPWRYRDYLIRAFNQDVPYNQFVREHIAGDLLPQPRRNAQEKLNESVIGTAFYRFGEVGHDNFREIGYDVVDNQIDTLAKAFQATTIACARCHDHKLDAISSRDYYALFGVLTSARQVIHTTDAPDTNQALRQELRTRKREIRAELARLWQQEMGEAPRYLLAAQRQMAQAPDAATLAKDLNSERLKAWVAALNASASLEEPLHPWRLLAQNTNLPTAWENLVQQHAQESRKRREFNATHFTPLGDFGKGEGAGWGAEGMGIQDGTASAGEFAVLPEGDAALNALYPAGIYTHLLSERFNGSLRSPVIPREKRFLSVLVMGGKGAHFRSIPDFRQLGESATEVKKLRPEWVRMGKSDRDEKVYVDLVTRADNLREGYRSDNPNLGEQRSYFGAVRAVLHDVDQSPQDELSHLNGLLQAPAPPTLEAAAERGAEVWTQAVRAWAEEKASEEDVRWLDALLRQGLLRTDVKASPRLQTLVEQYREAEKRLTAPRVVVGVADVGDGYDFPVFVRGDFRQYGEVAPRRYLEVFCKPGERFTGRGSGRLELADRLASPTNPLTARVMVNRVWHHLFGEGLVRTPDDFGHLGDTPSHPELLDYLAAQFIREGWSLKRLLRSLVLTRAFQMASTPSAKSRQIDPTNRLLQHFPVRRMTAEMVRDGLLLVSGRLDRTLYGPSIDPYREKPTPERRLFSGPLDGTGRRSLYTKITLMEGPAFLNVFNFPDPKAAQGRRDVTNVPTQALTLLNDPLVIDQSRFWAKRLLGEKDTDVSTRLTRMFVAALGRPPSRSEAEQFTRFVGDLQTLHNVPSSDLLTNEALWKDVAHTLFNLKEFLYIR